MTATLDESPDRHRWTFDAHRITRLSVEPSALRIETWTLESSAEVRIAAPFRYREPDGSARTIDPAEPDPVLEALERKGYLKSRVQGTGRRARRLYRATRKGRTALGFAKERVRELFEAPRRQAAELHVRLEGADSGG
jgi:hypothetical protein